MFHTRYLVPVGVAFFVILGGSLTATTASAADPKVEAAAQAMQKKAMGEDYLATDFAKAKDRLDKAIASCAGDKCGTTVRAALLRDLGVVLLGGNLDKVKGNEAFIEAIKLDPKIALDPDVKTKELENAFDAAKKSAAATSGPTTGPTPPGPTTTPEKPEGDFNHTPAAEQAVRTPLPIYAEYTGSESVVKVIARYKAVGMTEWKPIELKKMGENGWGTNVPCMEMQTGRISYFIQGFNEANDPIASAGDRKHPFVVNVKQTIESEAPHLPGQPALAQCADTGDCPPDFPGCKASKPPSGDDPLRKDEGSDCDEDNECKSNKCRNNKCLADEKKAPYSRVWIGANLSLDLDFLPSATNVCSLDATTAIPNNGANYYCYDSSASRDFPRKDDAGAENKTIVLGKNNRVDGGTSIGQFRAMLTFDYALTANFLLGARLGVAVPGYPGQQGIDDGVRSPLGIFHLEARGTYLFGKDALMHDGLAPYAMAHIGVSSFESSVDVKVSLASGASTTEQAWKLGGPFFAGIGGGVRYAVSKKAALLGGLRLDLAFDASGAMPVLAPEVGFQVGL